MEGNLVGVNTAILSRSGGYQGIGFAIPTQMAKPIMDSLVLHGRVDRGWLGIGIQDVNQDLAQALKLPSATGVLISEVKPGGPGDKGGLRRGDVIVSVNGATVDSTGRLRNLVASAGADQRIKLDLVRDGKALSLTIRLGMMSPDRDRGRGGNKAEPPNPKDFDGLSVETLDTEARSRYHVERDVRSGVIVTGVAVDSVAEKAGLLRGDVILEVGRQPVNTREDFARLYRKAKGNVLLVIFRRGATLFVVVKR
jgi:serine protease Do